MGEAVPTTTETVRVVRAVAGLSAETNSVLVEVAVTVAVLVVVCVRVLVATLLRTRVLVLVTLKPLGKRKDCKFALILRSPAQSKSSSRSVSTFG